VAVDYPRAMAAYKVGGEGGIAVCQWQVGFMYCKGLGVDVDDKQALPWLQKAAAQGWRPALGQLGTMYANGRGVTPSWRRAREHYERSIGLGHPEAVKSKQTLTRMIQEVTSQAVTTPERSHPATSRMQSTSSTFANSPTPFPTSLSTRNQTAPLMDKRVEVHGTSRADLNGKHGVATDFHSSYPTDRTKERYTVQLDSGEAFKVRPASVRAEGAGGGGGGGGGGGTGAGKAKGKGKKGRSGRK